MPLGFVALLAVVGVAALIFSIFSKGDKKPRIAAAIAGTLIFLAAAAYYFLVLILVNGV